jgi:hypothetical protein
LSGTWNPREFESAETGRICPDRLWNRRPWPYFLRPPHKRDGFVQIGFGIDGPGRTFHDAPQTGRICPDRLRNRWPWPHFLRHPTNRTDLSGSAPESTTPAVLSTIPSQTGRICMDWLQKNDGSGHTFYDPLTNRTDLSGSAPESTRVTIFMGSCRVANLTILQMHRDGLCFHAKPQSSFYAF